MAKGSSYVLQYRRKREGKTNYKKRLNLLKSGNLRLVVRSTNKHVRVQLVEYTPNGDKVIIQTHSSMLKKYGWKNSTSNIPAAYLTGLLCGVASAGSDAVVDSGLKDLVGGSMIYAAVNGAIDGGLNIPCSSKILPEAARIKGEHINEDTASQFNSVRDKIIESKK